MNRNMDRFYISIYAVYIIDVFLKISRSTKHQSQICAADMMMEPCRNG